MINVGRYMAAAREGPNVASKLASARGPVLTGLKHVGHHNRRIIAAGLENSKSAWIQNIGSGYGRRPRGAGINIPNAQSFRTRSSLMSMGSDYTRPDYSRVTGDQDLSRLL